MSLKVLRQYIKSAEKKNDLLNLCELLQDRPDSFGIISMEYFIKCYELLAKPINFDFYRNAAEFERYDIEEYLRKNKCFTGLGFEQVDPGSQNELPINFIEHHVYLIELFADFLREIRADVPIREEEERQEEFFIRLICEGFSGLEK